MEDTPEMKAYKAKIAEHIKQHPQAVSIDITTAPLTPPAAPVEPIPQAEPEEASGELEDGLGSDTDSDSGAP